MKSVSIIRKRGQLTIPDSIRKSVNWVNPLSAVTITVVKPDEIVIRPQQNFIDWQDIWARINTARSIKGRGRESASAFLQKDRNEH